MKEPFDINMESTWMISCSSLIRVGSSYNGLDQTSLFSDQALSFISGTQNNVGSKNSDISFSGISGILQGLTFSPNGVLNSILLSKQ